MNARRKGQGLVEYVLVVGLVAFGAVALVSHFGGSLRTVIAGQQDQLAGVGQIPDFRGGNTPGGGSGPLLASADDESADANASD